MAIKEKICLVCIMLMLSTTTLFGFSFTATPTPETCSGNGTITFSSSNTNPNGTLVYVVYKMPDVTTLYATVTGNLLSGLTAATYRVIAKETVDNISTEQQVDVVVDKTIVDLKYVFQSLNQACSDTSDVTIVVTSGTAVSYEIFSGPVTFPAQPSNTFTGLPVGVYQFRVFDACGGIVKTFTVNQNAIGLTIGQPSFTSATPPSCDYVTATNTLIPAPGTVIGYPLTITYTVHPPGGGTPITSSSNLLSGNPTSQDLVATIPSYANQNYDYDITVVDACNSEHTQNFPVDLSITITSNTVALKCNQNYFKLEVKNYTPPYTLNFTSVPAGFDPSLFNADYPGTYNQSIVQFGSETNLTPLGSYTVEITDSCGKKATTTFSIVLKVPTPNAVGTNNGCLSNSGKIVISIPSFGIVAATMTSAPAGFPHPLPYNVTSFVDAFGVLILDPVPIGDYVIELTDVCSSSISPINCTVPAYEDQGLSANVAPGCGLQKTSIELLSNNGKLKLVSITAAPTSFSKPLPYVVTNNITANGKLYINDLPGGTYTFLAVDDCNFSNTINVDAPGYSITTSNFSLSPNCGTFNIPLEFLSNGTINETFWFQKLLDPVANIWGNPATDVAYPDNTVPNNTNSIQLVNHGTNFNLSYNGTFRIVRSFDSYNDGVSINSVANSLITNNCIEPLSPTMTFNQAIEILDANRNSCSPNGNLDVIIKAKGVEPLKYSITSKDGASFILDNKNSNIFYGLDAGVYSFQVEDACGNIVNRIYDVAKLSSLVHMGKPNSILKCQNAITGSETFDITKQNSIILGTQSKTDYTLTYYTSLTDAQSATHPIPNLTNFKPTTNPQTIYARLVLNILPNCYEIATFDLIIGKAPIVNLKPDYLNCISAPITLNASVGNLPATTYLWSDGTTNPVITISQPGTTNLSITATNSYGTNGPTCDVTKDISVTVSAFPQIDHFETVDWTENENSITVFTTNNGAFEYSLDNNNYQDNPSFTNLMPGVYTVYVRDKKGCGLTQKTIWILYYKRYFTPNSDGYNERWKIENSNFEPNLKVIIYDRYGKTMASFDSNSEGWDGTYNGKEMFADDYWFVVYRQDGRVHKGHFSLKR